MSLGISQKYFGEERGIHILVEEPQMLYSFLKQTGVWHLVVNVKISFKMWLGTI